MSSNSSKNRRMSNPSLVKQNNTKPFNKSKKKRSRMSAVSSLFKQKKTTKPFNKSTKKRSRISAVSSLFKKKNNLKEILKKCGFPDPKITHGSDKFNDDHGFPFKPVEFTQGEN